MCTVCRLSEYNYDPCLAGKHPDSQYVYLCIYFLLFEHITVNDTE